MKKIILGLFLSFTLVGLPKISAGGGDAALGAFGGSMFGSMMGQAMKGPQSESRTVIVREPSQAPRQDLNNVEMQNYKIKQLEEMVHKLQRELEDLRYEIRRIYEIRPIREK